jgi:iron(III) transport system ATP-binding protein
MDQGRIVQIGSPRDIYERPRDDFVADFVGTTNFVNGEVAATNAEPAGYVVRVAAGALVVSSSESFDRGDKVTLSIRPEDVQVSTSPMDGPNTWDAVVDTHMFLGFCQDLALFWGPTRIEARVHPSLIIESGSRVRIRIAPERCVVCR